MHHALKDKMPGRLWVWRKKILIHCLHALYREKLRRDSVESVVVWNGLKKHGAILVDAARQLGIPCVFMENGLLPSTTVCDPQGINALNSVPRDPAFYRQLAPAPAPRKALLQARKEQAPKQASGGRPLPSRYIFIPFQVDSDTQILLFSPWISDMRQLFNETLKLSLKFPQYQLVFKEHPSSTRSYRDLHDLLPSDQGMFANEYPTQTLIENAEAVITINSTVGIEALLYGKKVISLGEAFYALADLCLTAGNAEDLEAAISKLMLFEPDEQLRRNFFGWLEEHYLIRGNWRTADEAHCQQVKERLLSYLNGFRQPAKYSLH
jgi:capsular polysaccharide export protein